MWTAQSFEKRNCSYHINVDKDGFFNLYDPSKQLVPKRIPRQPKLELMKKRCEKIERKLKKERIETLKKWRKDESSKPVEGIDVQGPNADQT